MLVVKKSTAKNVSSHGSSGIIEMRNSVEQKLLSACSSVKPHPNAISLAVIWRLHSHFMLSM